MHEIIIGWGFMSARCLAMRRPSQRRSRLRRRLRWRTTGPTALRMSNARCAQAFSTAPVFAPRRTTGRPWTRWSWLDASRAPWVMAAGRQGPAVPPSRSAGPIDALAEGEPAT